MNEKNSIETYKSRIQQLHSLTKTEGNTINEKSDQDFWNFMQSMNFPQKALIGLAHDRDINVLWKRNYGNLLSITFIGNGFVKYVIFEHYPDETNISRDTGFNTLNGIKRRIDPLLTAFI